MLFKLLRWWTFALLLLLLVPAVALADPAHNPPSLVLPSAQLWALLVGALVPLVTYVINHVGPWATEPIKAFVVGLAAAIAGGLTTAIATNVFGLNTETLQLVLTSIGAAFAAHKLVWLPSGVSTILGGGTNRAASSPRRRRVRSHPAGG